MAYDKPFGQYTDEEKEAITLDMKRRWGRGQKLLRQRSVARTAQERTAINQELAGLGATILPDTTTLLG
jgi:hypothetical protein